MEQGAGGQEEGQGPEDPSLTADARGRLMKEVAEQMDAIEADYGSNFQIGRVITIVEVARQSADGEAEIELRVRAGMYPWVALGMIETAKSYLQQA
jgi:hypothetical protein